MSRGSNNIDRINTLKASSVGFHRWFVFLSACVVMINGYGLLNTIGSLFAIVMDTFKTSRAEAVLIQSMAYGCSGIMGIITGSFVHKYNPRKCGMVGACLTVIGLCLCFFATSVIYLYIGIGFMYGSGLSLLAISYVTIVGHHFDGKLKLVVLSLISVTSAIGGMTYPYALVWLNDMYGLRGALLVIAALLFNSFASSMLWKIPEVTNSQQNICNDPNSLRSTIEVKHEHHDKYVDILDGSKLFTEESNKIHVNSDYILKGTNPATYNNIDNNAIILNSCKPCNGNTDTTKMNRQAGFGNADVATEKGEYIEMMEENHKKSYKAKSCRFDVIDKTDFKSINKVKKETIKPNTINIIDSFKELLGSGMFGSFAVAVAFINVSVNVYLFLVVDIFRDQGFSQADSSFALLLMSMFSILGRFSSGTLTLIPHVTVLSISCAGAFGLAISHVSVMFVNSSTMMLFLSCVFGVCMGIARAQFVVTTSRLLDKHQLSIGVGVILALDGCFNIFVGPLCGYARDQLGSYRPIHIGAAITAGIGCCLFGLAQYLNSRKKRLRLARIAMSVSESLIASE